MEEWAFGTTLGGTSRDYQRDAFPPFPAKNQGRGVEGLGGWVWGSPNPTEE